MKHLKLRVVAEQQRTQNKIILGGEERKKERL